MADIKGYLKTISDGKSGETVRDAIINCMRDINEDGAVKKASLVITKPDNVTYKPGKGKAFSSVTVNITGGESDPNKTINYETMTVTELTENGTYPPEDQPDTYYSKVEVAIDWDAVGNPSNLGEEAEMISYETDENGNKYWDASLAGYDYVKRIWIPNSVASGLPGGDYPGGGGAGPFRIEFYDKQKSKGTPNLITALQVEKGGDAAYEFTAKGFATPTYGGTFGGWSPPVNKVTGSVKTYATYTPSPSTGSPDEINESWDEIVASSDHSKYLGKFKPLEIKDYATEGMILLPENQYYKSKVATDDNPDPTHPTNFYELYLNNPSAKFTLNMQCVALGESGSKSTWLAMNPLPTDFAMDNSSVINSEFFPKNGKATDDWNSCFMNQFFEKCLRFGFPEVVKSHTMDVQKWSWGASQYSPIVGENNFSVKSSGNHLWIPSVGEIDSKFEHYTNGNYVEKREKERASTDYGQIWTPEGISDNVSICTRSLARVDMYWGNMGCYNGNETTGTFDVGGADFHNLNHNIYIGFCLV